MNKSQFPEHVAIIMDGNGRWAKQRFLPRLAGHKAGLESAKRIVKACVKQEIKVLTLFAFSSENWQRPRQEVNHLMELFLAGLEREVSMLHDHHVQLRFIGDRMRFNEKLRKKIDEVENLTRANPGLILIIAADYGGQWDITQAVTQLAIDIENGRLISSHITPQTISEKLSFADLPNPDLFIRTSGELRISNFMLWQLAYSELYFTDTLWPDFDETAFEQALNHYANRDRRFGLSKEN